MKRLCILTAIAIVTASTTGCGCFRCLWNGFTGTISNCVHGSPNSGVPCVAGEQCYDSGYSGAGYADAGYAGAGCPGGTCADSGASLGMPYAQGAPPVSSYGGNVLPSDSYVLPPSNVIPETLPTPNGGVMVPVPNGA